MIELFKFVKLNDIPDFLKQQLDIPDFDGSLYQKFYEQDLDDEFKTKFKEYFSNLIGNDVEISFGWINYTKYSGVNNDFNWHNENGVNGDIISNYEKSCVFWLSGEKNKGGGFKYIDDDGNISLIELDPPGFIIITKYTLHSVENYLGNKCRVSFNFNFEQK